MAQASSPKALRRAERAGKVFGYLILPIILAALIAAAIWIGTALHKRGEEWQQEHSSLGHSVVLQVPA